MNKNPHITYGYGFTLQSLTTKNFIKFIRKHMNTVNYLATSCPITSDTAKSEINRLGIFCHYVKQDEFANLNIHDMNEDFNKIDDNHGHQSIFCIIALIMKVETNIRFEYQDDYGSEPSILLPALTPWHFTQTEKNLTSQKDLDIILKPYTTELNIPDTDIHNLIINNRKD